MVAEYDLPPNAAFSEETLIRLNPDLLVIPSWKYDNEQDPSKDAGGDFAEPSLSKC